MAPYRYGRRPHLTNCMARDLRKAVPNCTAGCDLDSTLGHLRARTLDGALNRGHQSASALDEVRGRSKRHTLDCGTLSVSSAKGRSITNTHPRPGMLRI